MNSKVNDVPGPRALTPGEMKAVSGGAPPPPFSNWPNSRGAFYNEGTTTGVVFDYYGYWIGSGKGNGVVTFHPYTPPKPA